MRDGRCRAHSPTSHRSATSRPRVAIPHRGLSGCVRSTRGPGRIPRPNLVAMAVNESLVGRRAFRSGGASGIGRACAVRLAGACGDVVVVDRDADAKEAVAAEVGGTAVALALSDLLILD